MIPIEDWKVRMEISAKELGISLMYHALISPGDMYLAARHRNPVLLTCKEIKDGYIIPVETGAYFFDVGECVKIYS